MFIKVKMHAMNSYLWGVVGVYVQLSNICLYICLYCFNLFYFIYLFISFNRLRGHIQKETEVEKQ